MSDSLVNVFGTYEMTEENNKVAVDSSLTAGYRLFDTAKYYLNEKELGDALKSLLPKHGLTRADFFLATKFFPESKDCREACRKFVDESLERLQTDYIDMYLVHYPNDDVKNPEYGKIVYKVLEEAQAARKICSIGVSNFKTVHLEELETYAKIPPCANQLEYTIIMFLIR